MKTGADAAAANVQVSMICTHVTILLGIEPQEAPLCIAGIILIEMEPRTVHAYVCVPAGSVEFPAQTHMQFV